MRFRGQNKRDLLEGFGPVGVGAATFVVLWSAHTYGWMSHRSTFWAATIGMIVYIAAEALGLWKTGESRWLVAPPVLISGMTFVLNFAGTNVLYLFRPMSETWAGRVGMYDFYWLARAMLLAFAGLVAMWAGYKLVIAKQAGQWLKARLQNTGLLRSSFRPRWTVIWGMFAASFVVRIIMISTGLYGYVGSLEKKQELAAVMQYVGILENLSLVVLVVVALYVFSEKHRSLIPYLVLGGLLAIEILFGLFAGYKSKVVIPAIVVGICIYIASGRFPWKMSIGAVVLVLIAYMVVEPLRDITWQDGREDLQNIGNLSATVSSIASGDAGADNQRTANDVFYEFLDRQNLMSRCAVAVHAYDTGRIPEARDRFQRHMTLSPIYAVVPRLVWPSKWKQNLGAWFHRAVLDARGRNAVAMTGVGYLYIAGGLPLVIGFMFLVGSFGRVVQDGVLYAGAGGVVLFLVIVRSVAQIPQPAYQLVVEIIRFVPISLGAQYILFRR